MNANMDRKQELESALKQYLSQAEMHPFSCYWELVEAGEHVLVFGLAPFYLENDTESQHFLVPREADHKLMEKVDSLFHSQIRAANVRKSLSGAMTEVGQEAEFIFPFETDEQERQYHDRFYELLKSHYEYRGDAIVPLYQLECAAGVEFPLANAVLYPGGKRSRLASIANNEDNPFRDADREQIEHRSYLKFPVTGDPASRLEQLEHETDRALQVLRLVYPWFDRDGQSYNPAHGVSTWKHSWRVLVYDRATDTRTRRPWSSAAPIGIQGTQRISSELLEDATKYYSLESINFHFQNHDCNLVSSRFCWAIEYYDIASQTSDAFVALANYAICVDILLPSGNAKELTKYLIYLIEHGGLYEGKMTLNEQLTEPKKTGWPELVRLTVSDYRNFYIIRDMVVHGNTISTVVSKKQLKKARQLAKNAILAYAKLSRAFVWETDRQAKEWFKSPHSPSKKAKT